MGDEILEILKEDPFFIKSIKDESIIRDFSRWDSLKHLMFLIEVERKFKFKITPKEAVEIITIKDLRERLEDEKEKKYEEYEKQHPL